MTTKFAAALAAILISLSVCTFAAPSASAAAPSAPAAAVPAPTPAGSVGICLGIPLGFIILSFCL